MKSKSETVFGRKKKKKQVIAMHVLCYDLRLLLFSNWCVNVCVGVCVCELWRLCLISLYTVFLNRFT